MSLSTTSHDRSLCGTDLSRSQPLRAGSDVPRRCQPALENLLLRNGADNLASPDQVVPWSPDRILSTLTKLPSSWADYFKLVKAPFLSLEAARVFERTMATHAMSLPLTLLHALERFDLSARFANASNRKDLVVHLLGAEAAYEAEVGAMHFEEVLHFLPGVKTLRLVMVGPRMCVCPLRVLVYRVIDQACV